MPVTFKINSAVLLLSLGVAVASKGQAQGNLARSASRLGDQASAALAAGRKSYEAHCAMCHGLDARGGEHAPSIANSRTVQAASDNALMQTIRQGIPRAGMPSFSYLPDSEIAAVVKYVRSLSGLAKVESVKGDPLHGEKLFFGKAQCSDCHMLMGKGGFIGSDLSDFALTHSPEQIREAIVRPNEKLLPWQQVVSVETVAGQRLSGVVRNEDNFSVQFQARDGSFHFLDKTELQNFSYSDQPLMPTDYGTRLSNSELDDLVSFLANPAAAARKTQSPDKPTAQGK